MTKNLQAGIQEALSVDVVRLWALSDGLSEVHRADLADGRTVVAKVDHSPQPQLEREAFMLEYLAGHSSLPAPQVLFASPRLLVMTHIAGSSHYGPAAEVHAAELLAALHTHTAPAYGLERDTLIGGLHQPNPWTRSWRQFFGEQRLIFMAGEAQKAGRLSAAACDRVERLAARLERWLPDDGPPSLLHGDVWSGNVLAEGNRITGFLDPAIYYGDAEIELAFISLFSTFGANFFDRYGQLRPLRPGFREERRDLYNLYPLLVHVRLFGGSFVAAVDATLRRYGI